jgi:hypothetical protein
MMDESPRESRKGSPWRTKRAVVYLVLLLLLIALIVYVHGIQRVDPRKLDRLIGQNLPPGTDKARVLEFLDSNHIGHSEYLSDYRRIDANILRSTIGLVNGQIHIEFKFDERGKLVGHRLSEAFPWM